jgi:peptidoglycan/LPS O-acetylase OafA/YrhL
MVLGAHAVRTAGFPDWFKPYSGYLWNGTLGVSVFFVISGFLITWLLLVEQKRSGKIDLMAFYKRRTLRIFPVFYVFLLTVLLLSNWLYRDFSFAEWLSAATFTRNYFQGHWTLGHLWSISVEEQFYLLWPFALVMFKTEKRLLIAAAAVIVLAPFVRVGIYLSPWRWVSSYAIFTHADSLMYGCLLAILASYNRLEVALTVFRKYRRAIQLSLIVLIYGVWMLAMHGLLGFLTVPFGATLQGAAIAGLIASVVLVQEGTLYRLLNLRVIAAIGTISYSLYIWQQLILYPANYPDGVLWWRTFPTNIILVFVIGSLSYIFIEKTFLKIKQKSVIKHEEKF